MTDFFSTSIFVGIIFSFLSQSTTLGKDSIEIDRIDSLILFENYKSAQTELEDYLLNYNEARRINFQSAILKQASLKILYSELTIADSLMTLIRDEYEFMDSKNKQEFITNDILISTETYDIINANFSFSQADSLLVSLKRNNEYYQDFEALLLFLKGKFKLKFGKHQPALYYFENAILKAHSLKFNQKNNLLKARIENEIIYCNMYIEEENYDDFFDKIDSMISFQYQKISRYNLKKHSIVSELKKLESLIEYYKPWFHSKKNDLEFVKSCKKRSTEITLEAEKTFIDIFGKENFKLIGVYNHLANLSEGFNNALKYHNKGLKISNIYLPPKNKSTCLILNNIAGEYVKLSRKNKNTINSDSALLYYQKSLITASKKFNSFNILMSPKHTDEILDDNFVFEIIGKKARTIHEKYKINKNEYIDTALLDKSIQVYSDNIQFAETMFERISNNEEKVKLANKIQPLYETVIKVVLERNSLGKCDYCLELLFEVFQKSDNKFLIEKNKIEKIKSKLKIDTVLINYERELKDKIKDYKNAYQYHASYQYSLSEMLDSINYFEDELIKVKSQIEQLYPNLYSENFSEFISSKECVSFLAENELLLFTFLESSKRLSKDDTISLHTLTLTKNQGLSVNTKKIKDSFYKTIEEFRNCVFNDTCSTTTFYGLSENIFTAIFEPIKDKISNKNLLVIADSKLGKFPFEVLLTDYNKVYNDWSKAPYLFKQNNIHYAYTPSLFFKKSKNNDNKISGIGFAPFANSDVNLAYLENTLPNFRRLSNRSTLEQLPNTKRELDSISNYINMKTYFDEEASESNFVSESSKHNLLHIASHGLVVDTIPEQSCILFKKDNSSLYDGVLTINELYRIDLSHLDLLVLSTCVSGAGQELAGEGTISVARGFTSAGVSSSIITLWYADDRAIADLMISFYKYLGQGLSKSVSLSKAKIDYLKNTLDNKKAHPAYWATPILIGNNVGFGDMLDSENYTNGIYILLLFLMLILFLLIFIRFR